jgi:glutathione S-transferase
VPDYIEIEEARTRGGMRLVLTAGVPGPWGEAAKNIFWVKKIKYVPVRQIPGESEKALAAWTAQTSAPVAVYEDERPRSSWAEILYLAERLAPTPSLIPSNPSLRIEMFGLCHELCGETGLGWQRRLMLLNPMLAGGAAGGVPALLGVKYGYSPGAGASAPERCAEILRGLSDTLQRQRERGRRYFVGDALSALDLYWAAFAALVDPLPHELCPMNEGMRAAYTLRDEGVLSALDPVLLEHRDYIYREYLQLPLDF